MIQFKMLYYTRKIKSKISRATNQTLENLITILAENKQLKGVAELIKKNSLSEFKKTVAENTEGSNKQFYDICLFNLNCLVISNFFTNPQTPSILTKVKISEECKNALTIEIAQSDSRILQSPTNKIPEHLLVDSKIIKKILGIDDKELSNIGFSGHLIPAFVEEKAKKYIKEELVDYLDFLQNPSEIEEELEFSPIYWGNVRYTSKQFKRLRDMGLIE